MLYAHWPVQRGGRPYQLSDFWTRIVPNFVNTEADTFTFKTTEPVTGNPDLARIQVRVGRLVLFPSYMWHGTVPFEADQPRMTVAFDVVPG